MIKNLSKFNDFSILEIFAGILREVTYVSILTVFLFGITIIL